MALLDNAPANRLIRASTANRRKEPPPRTPHTSQSLRPSLGISSHAPDLTPRIGARGPIRQSEEVVQDAGPPDDSPQGLIGQQLQNLQQAFKPRLAKLEAAGLNRKEHNFHIDKLQAEYDQEKGRITEHQFTMDVLQRAMDNETLDPEAGIKAQYAEVLPREAVAAMFPRPESQPQGRVPFSPSALQSYSELAGKFADGADKEMTPNYRSIFKSKPDSPRLRGSLISQYRRYQEVIGYFDPRTTVMQQRQMDHSWDDMMKAGGDKYAAWTPMDVTPLRPYASTLERSFSRVTNSPFAQSFSKGDKTKKQNQVVTGSKEIKVKHKASGEGGWIPEGEFDAAVYERVK